MYQIWQASEAQRGSLSVARLVQALGMCSYDELLAFSTAEPARYWQAVTSICDIAWDVAPQGDPDDSRGPDFPRWFPGGRLNWVNTVLAWGRRPQTAVHLVTHRPKTRSSKIMRRVIRSLYADQPAGDLSSLDKIRTAAAGASR